MIPNQFRDDERAIEGLPIRLVIALVVGVAALALMMNMLSGLGGMSKTEVAWQVQDDASGDAADKIIDEAPASGSSGNQEVAMTFRDEDGDPLESGQAIIKSGSAQLDGGPVVIDLEAASSSGDPGEVTVNLDGSSSSSSAVVSGGSAAAELRADQDTGTLKVEINPPGDGKYTDGESNAEITVVEN